MAESNCPICYTELVTQKVTPCMNCGRYESKLNQNKNRQYREYELYFQQRLILCNFCDVDFSSYDPTYFGFKKDKKLGLGDFNFVKEMLDKSLKKDKYCPACKHRLPFLKFIQKCRAENKKCS